MGWGGRESLPSRDWGRKEPVEPTGSGEELRACRWAWSDWALSIVGGDFICNEYGGFALHVLGPECICPHVRGPN